MSLERRHQIDDLTLAEGMAVDPKGTIYVGEALPGQISQMVTGSTVRTLVRK